MQAGECIDVSWTDWKGEVNTERATVKAVQGSCCLLRYQSGPDEACYFDPQTNALDVINPYFKYDRRIRATRPERTASPGRPTSGASPPAAAASGRAGRSGGSR